MNTLARALRLAFLLLLGTAVHAAQETGSISGRVQDAATGRYLNNARVTLVGSNQDTFTNELGEYQINSLPPGEVTLRVYFTGDKDQTVTVPVSAGQNTTRDFALVGVFEKPAAKGDDAIVLDTFTVKTKKEQSAAEIAINEQRFAANVKSVVSTTAFGDIGQDNVGEFLKFMPGVEAVYGDMNISNVALRGMPSTATTVSMDGASVVSTSSLSTDRNVSFAAISLNSASRIEVNKSALPDQRADSTGGTVNMISRSAFERSRPELIAKVFVQMNSHYPELHKTPAGNDGGDGREYKWFPNWEINYVNPLSKTFGIAINTARNDKWVLTKRLTRGYTISNSDAAHPYMNGFTLLNYPSFETRNTASVRLDWKPAPRDVLAFTVSYNRYFSNFEQHNIAFSTGNLNAALTDGTRNATTGDFSPTFTQGRAGQGSVNQSLTTRYSTQPNAGGSLSYRHTGTSWNWDSIFSGNKSKVAYRNTSMGQFDQTRANKSGLTVRFDDINQYGPGRITAQRGTAAVDPLALDDAVFAPASNQTRDASASARNFNFNLERKLSSSWFYGSVKSGFSFRSDARDRTMGQYTPTYVGPDGIANSGDEVISALPPGTLADPVFSYYPMTRGYPAPQWISARKSNSLFLTHPEYFSYPVANANSDYQAIVGAAEELQEQVTAGYLMGNVTVWRNRLRLAGGARFEKTNDAGRGLLTDNSRQYQKDASGKIVDGNPNQAGVQPVPLTTDPLEISKLTRIPLGSHVDRSYQGYYPSLAATFNATSNLLLRLSYAKTLTRPNYGNILPTLSVNQVTNPADDASGSGLGTISAKNPNLKPWEANNYDASIEYYTTTGGLFSVGAFRKDVKNFFTNRTELATAEFLDASGLSHDYLNYQVTYPGNTTDKVRMSGVEIAGSQKVLRRFSVFANVSVNRNQGPRESDFRGYVRKRVNAGVSFSKRPVTFNMNFYYTGKYYNATSGIAPDGRSYIVARPRFDASLDVRVSRRVSVFIWGRNIFNDRDKSLIYGVLTPDYAKYNVESDYGVVFQTGVKMNW